MLLKSGTSRSLLANILAVVDLRRSGGGGGINIESLSAMFESDDCGFGVTWLESITPLESNSRYSFFPPIIVFDF